MPRSKKALVIIALFFFGLAVCCFLHWIQLETLIRQQRQERIAESTQNNAIMFEQLLEKDFQLLREISVEFGDFASLDSDESRAYLKTLNLYTGYIRMAVDLPDGRSYTSDDYQVDVSGMDYFPDMLSGQSVLSGLTLTLVEGEPSYAMAVPIYRNGIVVGGLRGVYHTDHLLKMSGLRVFEGLGSLALLDANGSLLTSHDNSIPQEHFLDVLQEELFRPPYTCEQIRRDLAEGSSGFTCYRQDSNEVFAYYAPLGTTEWYVFSSVPTSYRSESERAFFRMTYLLFGLCALALFVLIYFLIRRYGAAHNKLATERDALAQTLNAFPVPFIVSDSGSQIVQLNQAARTLLPDEGKQRSDLDPSVWSSLFSSSASCSEENNGCYERAGAYYTLKTAQLPNDSIAPGGQIHVLCEATSLTKSRQALTVQAEYYHSILRDLPGGVVVTRLDSDITVLYCNSSYLASIGAEASEVLNGSIFRWVLAEDAAFARTDITRQLELGDYIYNEHHLRTLSGRTCLISMHGKRTLLRQEPVAVWLLSDITDSNERMRELQRTEERYHLVSHLTGNILFDFDIASGITCFFSHATELYRISERMSGLPDALITSGVILPQFSDAFHAAFSQALQGSSASSCEVQTRSSDGHLLWSRISLSPVRGKETQNPIRIIGVMHNITIEVELRQRAVQETRYRHAITRNSSFCYEADITERKFIAGHDVIFHALGKLKTDDFDCVVQAIVDYFVYADDRDIVLQSISRDQLEQAYADGKREMVFCYRRHMPDGIHQMEGHVFLFTEPSDDHLCGVCYICEAVSPPS